MESEGSSIIEFRRGVIYLNKHSFAPEDEIAVSFAKALEEGGFKYVIVAGYVAILFGRGRRSDDIDFIVNIQSEEEFLGICRSAKTYGFNLMQGNIENPESVRRVYEEYIARGYSVRFMYRGIILPNVEFRAAITSLDEYSIEKRIPVYIKSKGKIYISPLELQIAYKLKLGSEKDVGDAVFLYELFSDRIDRKELDKWCTELGVDCSVLRRGVEWL